MTDQKQLNQIALWPAEQEAMRMLKAVGEYKTPGLPALLSILQWAVEDSGEPVGKAGQIMEEMLTLSMNKPKAAMRILLNLENPETETLPLLTEARTRREIAQAILALANQSVAMSQ